MARAQNEEGGSAHLGSRGHNRARLVRAELDESGVQQHRGVVEVRRVHREPLIELDALGDRDSLVKVSIAKGRVNPLFDLGAVWACSGGAPRSSRQSSHRPLRKQTLSTLSFPSLPRRTGHRAGVRQKKMEKKTRPTHATRRGRRETYLRISLAGTSSRPGQS